VVHDADVAAVIDRLGLPAPVAVEPRAAAGAGTVPARGRCRHRARPRAAVVALPCATPTRPGCGAAAPEDAAAPAV